MVTWSVGRFLGRPLGGSLVGQSGWSLGRLVGPLGWSLSCSVPLLDTWLVPQLIGQLFSLGRLVGSCSFAQLVLWLVGPLVSTQLVGHLVSPLVGWSVLNSGWSLG